MLIKNIFEKDIDRNIKGVIKVGQESDIRQELEEYVVTRELQKHFREFFSNYKRGIVGDTDKMGVWISGFFGSGKSHFLQILSYILENKEVEGKEAIDYFKDDNKIADQMVMADMELASSTPTDVVLFNIDSKSSDSVVGKKESLLEVFLKAFNEMIGLSIDPYVADLERNLMSAGKYSQFIDYYNSISMGSWEETRDNLGFNMDSVVKTLVEVELMSEEAARIWMQKTVNPYEMSIEEFAKLVKSYIDNKGSNHHVAFLVDEVGQYIGDDRSLMLNLQSIVEELGKHCHGKAWVIVTSQQAIDSITKVKGDDFSKIQGRFDTRINLTSANVDEVIKLRILEKNTVAKETLAVTYEQNETVLKNLINFNDQVEKKLYENTKDFIDVYPFIPYQLDILSDVLTAIRQYGATGKHLSEGERSMLGIFKESAERIMDQELGSLVSLDIFYDGLQQFLDHSHSNVVSKAANNKKINPMGEENNFNVAVLKVLFLIKYVDQIEANIENITSLMVSHIKDERLRLKEKVQEALIVLEEQALVQKNGDKYIFLTNEEQDVNNQIRNIHVEDTLVLDKVSEIIFSEILKEDKISYPKFRNRYNFGFNRQVDGRAYRSQSNDISLNIISPVSDLSGQSASLMLNSQVGDVVYVELPRDGKFLDEIKEGIKIERYMKTGSTEGLAKHEEIRSLKPIEMKGHYEEGRRQLEEALSNVNFYINGNRKEKKDFKNNVLGYLETAVDTVYNKLNSIDSAFDRKDILKMLRDKQSKDISMDTDDIANTIALSDLEHYILRKTRNHGKLSLREIKQEFKSIPYGFIDEDIEWMLVKLAVKGQINFELNGSQLSLMDTDPREIVDYLSKKQYEQKLLILAKEIIEPRYIKSLKSVYKEVFKDSLRTEDTDEMVKVFNQEVERYMSLLKTIENNYNSEVNRNNRREYPGKNLVIEAVEVFSKTIALNSSKAIFELVARYEDDYIEVAEDMVELRRFFEGTQKTIWDKSKNSLEIYENSKSFISDREVEEVVEEIKKIFKLASPYNSIEKLPALNKAFEEKYNQLLDNQVGPILKAIETSRKVVLDQLNLDKLRESYKSRVESSFLSLEDKAKSTAEIFKIHSVESEARKIEEDFLRAIERDRKELEERPKPVNGTGSAGGKEIRVKRNKVINYENLGLEKYIKFESEEEIRDYIKILQESLLEEMEENTVLSFRI